MNPTSTIAAVFTAFLLATHASFARIGETAEEIQKRYDSQGGVVAPKFPATKALEFEKNGFRLTFHLWNDKVSMIYITKIGESMDEDEVTMLLNTFSGDAPWPKSGFRRERSDKKMICQIYGFNGSLSIFTPEWAVSEEAKEKQDKANAIDGL